MARPEKIARVQAIVEHLRGAQSLVLADFSGLSVAEMTDFRAKCREKGVVCRVVKNRLAKIAADEAGFEVLKEHLTGPTAFIFGPESQIEPAKAAVEFAKENEKLQVKGGYVDGQYIDVESVLALSRIPGRDGLIAQMMGSINSPLQGIVGTLNGVMAAMTRALDAVAKQKAA